MDDSIRVSYLVDSDENHIRARSEALLLEQTVELPRDAIQSAWVADHILGRIERIEPVGARRFRVTIRQPLATAAADPAQLLNVLFGNSSLQADVILDDVRLPDAALTFLPGPRFGAAGLRALTGATGRPLVATALKPMGLTPEELARLARTFSMAGLDVVKDDHGLADHANCPFERRVEACIRAVTDAHVETGHRALYVPNLIGTPERVRAQLEFARDAGVQAVMLSPMLIGLPFMAELARDAGMAIIAHPSLSGVLRAAEPALLGTLFRWYGADAVIFPHAGGRFAYSQEVCGALAGTLRAPHAGLKPALPVPAGGIRLDGVSELLGFYGTECMLLIGGSLYQAGDHVADIARALVQRIATVAVSGQAETG